jgi:Holliday junction resolvase RusA-like endonuclease
MTRRLMVDSRKSGEIKVQIPRIVNVSDNRPKRPTTRRKFTDAAMHVGVFKDDSRLSRLR